MGNQKPGSDSGPGLPGGMPIRSFGTFTCKAADYDALIEKVAGIRQQFTVERVKERITFMLDQLLMKWIVQEGKDMFNLQVNAREIGRGIQEDLDMEMQEIGIGITSFAVSSFNYPREVQKMAEKAAAQSMIGDVGTFPAGGYGRSHGKRTGRRDGRGYGGPCHGNGYGSADGSADGPESERGRRTAGCSRSGRRNRERGLPAARRPTSARTAAQRTNGANFCPNCGRKLV